MIQSQLQNDWSGLDGGLRYLTQTAWYVNSVTGNDANNASVGAPIKTLAELTRRWSARTFSPAVTAVNVYLAGTFPTERLVLNATFTGTPGGNPPTVTISGTMTTVDSGTLSDYTAWAPATSTRGTLTDAAQDFTPHVRRRIRATSGAALDAVTWIGSLGGGITVANVGRFRTNTSYTGTLKDMAINDTYVIETFDTVIGGFYFECRNGWVLLRDVEIQASAANLQALCKTQTERVKIWGCFYNTVAGGVQVQSEGDITPISCAIQGTWSYQEGFMNAKSMCVFSPWFFYNCMVQADSTMCDGNGANAVDLELFQNANFLSSNTFYAVFGCTNAATYNALIAVRQANTLFTSQGYVFGSAGNLTTQAVSIANGGVFQYTTKPTTLTGVAPGTDVKLAADVAIAWASVPAKATAAYDNAVIQVRQ